MHVVIDAASVALPALQVDVLLVLSRVVGGLPDCGQSSEDTYRGTVDDLGQFVAAVTLQTAATAELGECRLLDAGAPAPAFQVAQRHDDLKDASKGEKLGAHHQNQLAGAVIFVQVVGFHVLEVDNSIFDGQLAEGIEMERRPALNVVYQRLLLCLSERHVLFEQR